MGRDTLAASQVKEITSHAAEGSSTVGTSDYGANAVGNLALYTYILLLLSISCLLSPR